MNVFEWMNTTYYQKSLSHDAIDAASQAWQTSRQLTFEEIAQTLENRSLNKPFEISKTFSDAAALVRALKAADS